MKRLNIYLDFKFNNFFNELLKDYEIKYNNINNLSHQGGEQNSGALIFINGDIKKYKAHLKQLSKEYLLITNAKNINEIGKCDITKIKTPISIVNIKNYIYKFLNNKVIHYEDIQLFDKKIINKKNKLSCNLTDIENNIFLYLIDLKECSKSNIKKDILKLNSKVETNSLDSHLTRIRKKLDNIKTRIKIQSKNDTLKIFS